MKKILRKELKKLRDEITDKELLSDEITKKFLESDLYKNCDTLLLYFSVGSEASTEAIFNKALSDKKAVAFPVCTDSAGKMEFFIVKSEADLTEGMYGIKAPKAYCKLFENSVNALCVVPGLSFDKLGYRIGYGKGYYDRFLENFKGVSVGICFEELVRESLPADDAYDKKVNCLITDKKIYKFYE